VNLVKRFWGIGAQKCFACKKYLTAVILAGKRFTGVHGFTLGVVFDQFATIIVIILFITSIVVKE
jgi:hypothetical protein